MDGARIEQETGWQVAHRVDCPSTNDWARAACANGPVGRQAFVATRQSAGRGREGRAFASPAGGLYVSLVLEVPPEDVPAGVVALVALAAAEAVETVAPVRVAIKWPNDLLVEGRKLGGILLETAGSPGSVIAGIGINLDGIPVDLPAAVRATTSALAEATGSAVPPAVALSALLRAVDRLQARRRGAGGREAIAAGWRRRIAFLDQPVTCRYRGADLTGLLRDVSLDRGLLIEEPDSGPVWRQAEHVQDLRPPGRTIG